MITVTVRAPKPIIIRRIKRALRALPRFSFECFFELFVLAFSASASEDFASIADKVPGTFMYLSAGFLDDRGLAPAHNPKVMFNEDVCPIGASCYAHCATEWLKNNK